MHSLVFDHSTEVHIPVHKTGANSRRYDLIFGDRDVSDVNAARSAVNLIAETLDPNEPFQLAGENLCIELRVVNYNRKHAAELIGQALARREDIHAVVTTGEGFGENTSRRN